MISNNELTNTRKSKIFGVLEISDFHDNCEEKIEIETNVKMEKILLDTNFLLIPYKFKIDIFSQIDKISMFKYKLFILDKTLEELKRIVSEQKGKDKDAAKIALKLIALKNIGVIKTKSKGKTDDIILEMASKDNFIVATQDKELRSRLKEKNVHFMVLRQKKKVVFFG